MIRTVIERCAMAAERLAGLSQTSTRDVDIALQEAAAQDAYIEVASEIRKIRESEFWRPIDTAPHGVLILLGTPPFACMGESAAWEIRVGMASWGERIGGISNISYDSWATHWMPLPSPPDDGAG